MCDIDDAKALVKNNLTLLCGKRKAVLLHGNFAHLFEWIYALGDQECKFADGKGKCGNFGLPVWLYYSAKVENCILKLRKTLSELQMKTPAWDHIECIVRTAVLHMTMEEQAVFVKDHVKEMLSKLYGRIKDCDGETRDGSEFKKWIKNLYGKGKVYIVGPMGERPIHVCGFAIAKYRGSGQVHIAQGILEGIQAYVEDKQDVSVLFEPYCKDYCSAVGQSISSWESKFPPYFEEIRKWRESKANMSGLYEGETLHFALIACGDVNAVKWLIEIAKQTQTYSRQLKYEETSLLDIKAKGLFFRPMYNEQLTSSALCELWQRYWTGGGVETNPHSSSETSYFGFDLLSFAACQGRVEIFELLFDYASEKVRSLLEEWKNTKMGYIHSKLKEQIQEDLKKNSKYLKNSVQIMEQISENLMKKSKHLKDGVQILEEVSSSHAEKFWDSLATLIVTETLDKFKLKTQSFLQIEFVRQVIVNRKDEFGNTMLHLAAWNSKTDMFDHLIKLGADLWAVNRDGLTPFTLAVRFGRWEMFKHIWERHFTKPYWRFGNVEADVVDYSQFETNTSGLGSNISFLELGRHINTLVVLKITKMVMGKDDSKERYGASNSNHQSLAEEHIPRPAQKASAEASPDQVCENSEGDAVVYVKMRTWFEKRLKYLVIREIFDKPMKQENERTAVNGAGAMQSEASAQLERTGSALPFTGQQSPSPKGTSNLRIQQYSPHFKSATEIITMFKPPDWYKHTKNPMHKHVMGKWSKGYYLVHFANTVFPYCVILLLFGLMWWQRKLHILEHHFWWTSATVVAPTPRNGIESACGWKAIRDSYSGRLQATLIIYGVPSLLRMAWVQSRLRPTDLDEDLNWRMSRDEIVNFIFMNLESLFHIIAASLFITIGSARVTSQTTDDIYQCSITSVRTEKNATSIAALVIFFNLFIVCKPYQRLGVLVQTMYRFLLKDVFNFLVMYGMLFLAFLLALQTLHNANVEYHAWMETSTEILPQVEQAQKLTYLENSIIPEHASSLLATETALQGCWSKGRTITDTAFALLEISFGDGLADAIEQARSKPFECAGFTPDFLTGYLLIFWVFVTNVLFLNMLIAMMNKTFNDELDSVESKMLLDVSYRILRYERSFPELIDHIEGRDQCKSIFFLQYQKALIVDVMLILFCIPEIHLSAQICRFACAKFEEYSTGSCCQCVKGGRPEHPNHSEHSRLHPNAEFWDEVELALKAASTLTKAATEAQLRETCLGCLNLKLIPRILPRWTEQSLRAQYKRIESKCRTIVLVSCLLPRLRDDKFCGWWTAPRSVPLMWNASVDLKHRMTFKFEESLHLQGPETPVTNTTCRPGQGRLAQGDDHPG